MLENKNFLLNQLFLYEHTLKNNVNFLKFAQHIEYMLITFTYSDNNNSEEMSKRISKNVATRLKLSSLLYLIFEENFKIKVLMESSSLNNNNKKNNNNAPQNQFLSIQRLLVTNRNSISALLENFFTHASLLNFIKRQEIISNKAENNTIVVLKYPLDAVEEAIGFDKRFEFPVKNLYLSITLKFKYALSSNDFLDLH